MKFYYVALTINKEQPVRTQGGKRLAYYIKKQQAISQCETLNTYYRCFNSHKEEKEPFKVYCVESEPTEVTID